MKRVGAIAIAGVVLSGCMAGEISPGDDGDRTEAEIKAIPQLPHKRVCDDPVDGFAACHARIRTDAYGAMALTATQIGECFAGEGVDAAHVNTVLGRLGGPVTPRS